MNCFLGKTGRKTRALMMPSLVRTVCSHLKFIITSSDTQLVCLACSVLICVLKLDSPVHVSFGAIEYDRERCGYSILD
jgi:hypothetical protein